ncbi:MAG: AbrB/MazE/SpoVT family DNA-binding domain-containing protein [Methanomicrobiales archaeon]|nr:AbrB/MazE/SpoVT family DNA-binding domain-containing protein [Methanomicrobiales archaeon]
MAKSSRHDESVLQPATSKSNSLRTTVPVSIVNQFNLKKGDKLNWGIEDGAVVIQVAKQGNKTLRS